jgi:spore germination protein KC
MKMKGNQFILALTLAMAAFTAGCWDYKEIDDQIIVSGAAIDYDRESKGVLLTAEIALPTSSGKESAFSSHIYQGKGQNIIDAAVDLRSKAGRRLLWSHSKVLIFSEEFIKKAQLFVGALDWMKRSHEMRDTVWLLLSEEATAAAILQKSDPQTQKIISHYLDYLFLSRSAETFFSVPFSKFMDDLQSASAAAVLPIVGLENSSTETLPFVNGTALLNQGKPAGRLDGKQTRILLLLTNNLKQAVFAPESASKEKVQAVSVSLTQSQTSIKPVLSPNGLIMQIRVKMEAEIGEIDGRQNVFTPDNIKKLTTGYQRLIENQIRQTLELLKQTYRSDVIGFGNKVEGNYPKLWKTLKSNWRNEYAKIPSDIRVKLTIPGSALSMKETKVGH